MQIENSEVAKLPTEFGFFNIQSFKEGCKEHLVLFTDDFGDIPTIRIHSECLTGDTLGSLKCDCGEQLRFALKYIYENGGLLFYLRQEGRGIGLLNKVNAYALQDKGLNTVEANHQLGFDTDLRNYDIVKYILNFFQIKKFNLLTNNPLKMESLKEFEIVKRIPIKIKPNNYNSNYLKVKKEEMGHLL